MSEQPRALVVKLSSLGDLFHPLPAVHQLKRALNLSIDWVTQPEYHDLVACFSDVERVMDYPRHNFIPAFSPFFKKMRRMHYDFVFDFQGLFKSGLTARMARAERRIGPAYYREGANIYYDEIAGQRDKNRHAVEEALDFVRHFKLEPVPPVFPVRFPQVEPEGSAPWIALAPCSRWPTKNWPPESFARLARLLRERVGGTCFIIGGSQDAEVGDRIVQEAGEQVVNLCGRTTLPELGGYLSRMNLLITVDSGPMHMAAAVGAPVLAIFGATDPRRTGPYGSKHMIVQHGGLTCQPCRSRTCKRPEKDIACLTDLSPDRVLQTALELLKKHI